MLCKNELVCQYSCFSFELYILAFFMMEILVCYWARCIHGPRVCAKHEDYIHTMPTDLSVSYLLNDFAVSADMSPQPLRPVLM